jgi:YidC/Oxa1 family membrane protein insertase
MPNIRMLLWGAFAFLLYMNYQAWVHDYDVPTTVAIKGAPGTSGTPSAAADTLGDTVPQANSSATNTATTPTTATAPASASPAIATSLPEGKVDSAQQLSIKTDVLNVSINLKGGELDRAQLLQYPLRKDAPNIPVTLFDHDDEASLYVLQTGLTGGAGESAPTHLATWTAAQSSFVLENGANELRVPMTWTDGQGLSVTKTFVFRRGWYSIDLIYDVKNDGSSARKLASYSQFLRHWEHASRSYFDVETYSFKGPAIFNGTKQLDLKVENDQDSRFSETVTNGWLASMQHHFVAAIVPTPDQSFNYQLTVRDHQYLLSATGPSAEVAPGATAQFHEKLFVGPKLQSQLAATGPRLDLTADYGKLTVLAKPLFWLLKSVHGIIGNWGWSIIIVTALIKLCFYPLSQASGRSMAKMRAVAPRLKQIQETYKDDREKLGRAMMELYKREKINPLAGCLPMLVQIPFFISFYWVLLESVEMRQAPFMLWINDLSSKDPYFVLPLLMGGAMFAQFKLNPAPPDPMQAKIMQFMPLVMTAMMAWFPSGLVLYWLTNTVLSIAQQYRVNQVVEAEAAKLRS